MITDLKDRLIIAQFYKTKLDIELDLICHGFEWPKFSPKPISRSKNRPGDGLERICSKSIHYSLDVFNHEFFY